MKVGEGGTFCDVYSKKETYLIFPGKNINVRQCVLGVAEAGLELGAELLEIPGLGGDVDDAAAGVHDGDEGAADLGAGC